MSYHEHLTAGLATIWSCSASEAAERIAPKRKRISYDSVREDVPWTAARCNRLLRTITSRVSILRRQSKLCASSSSANNAESKSSQQALLERTPPSRRDHRLQASDPAWVPGAKSKAPTRIYSSKLKSQLRPASRKTDSGFSTPFVKRILSKEASSTKERVRDSIGQDGSRPQGKKLRQLPIQLASSNEEAQRNLVTAFNSLLTATCSPSTPQRTGARSLMSACLRRVPGYIDLEAEEVHKVDINHEDITSSIYSELENLGTNSDGGWSELREVVRSHCVHHVCAAIEEGLIQEARISELVTACSRNGALLEADSLVRSWLSGDQIGALSRIDDSHGALTKLAELRTSHDASELYLRQHTDLIHLDRVWITDVLRSGSALLKDLIKALIRGPGQDVALAYLEAAVVKDCETSNTTSLPVFARLAGLLASIALAQAADSTDLSTGLDLSAVVHRIAVCVMQSQKEHIHSLEARRNAIHPFIMADTLLRLAALPVSSLIVAAATDVSIAAVIEHQDALVKFACNVAHHVFRFSDANELQSLLLTTSAFLSPLHECSSEHRDVLSRLGFEIAFAFSEQTGVSIDHHFADSLLTRDGSRTGSDAVQTPRRRVQVSGFKWEEGLCEWVAATPLPTLHTTPALPSKHENTPKQLPTPKQERPERGPRKSVLVLPSSPDIIAKEHTGEIPTLPKVQPGRKALQERSANRPPLQPVRISLDKEKKTSGLLKPVVPKQVHLKVERAKKAALLAQNEVSKQLRRSFSLADSNEKGDDTRNRIVLADTDELGTLTPVRKKPKGILMPRGVRQSLARVSLPARGLQVDLGVMSDDELGL